MDTMPFRWHTPRHLLALVALLAVSFLAAACGVGSDGAIVEARAGLPDNTTTTTPDLAPTTTTTSPSIELDTIDDEPVVTTQPPTNRPPTPDPITTRPDKAGAWADIVVDVETFWGDQFDDFAGSGSYEPLDRDRIVAAVDGATDLPFCDNERVRSSNVDDNAFAAVCPEGQLVVWDEDDLFAELHANYGVTGPAIVIAHEFGHVMQFQARRLGQPTVIVEQQADCLAGAYARWAADRAIAPFDTAAALDAAVGATVSFRDHPGSSPAAAGAHGSGFDRVRAFQDGFDNGVGFCAGYDTSLELTEFPFGNAEDRASGGNLPFANLIELVNPYFDTVFATRTDNWTSLQLTEADLADWRPLHRSIGDNATGTGMALAFARQLQEIEGVEASGPDALLQQSCLAGAAFRPLIFADDVLTPDDLSLSPGDMDEAVLTMSRIVESNEDVLEDGFLFDAVTALRTGFAGGFDVCGI